MDYLLRIARSADGTYKGELQSSEGDLWTDLTQRPQQGEQFKVSLLLFAEQFGIPVQVVESAPAQSDLQVD